MMRRQNIEKFGLLERFRFQLGLLWRMLRFGSSNGLQFLLECIGIAAFGLMIASLGETPAAATTAAISVNMLVFVPIFGLSTAVSTLVGQQIGHKQPELAARATWTSLQIALLYTGFFAAAYLLFPGFFLFGYEAGAENFDDIRQLTKWLLMFVAAYCIFDAIQIVFVGAIKGAGDARFVVIASLICSTLFVLFGVFGQRMFTSVNGQLFWWWTSLTTWIVLLCFVFGGRFLQGKWKSMRVIEKQFAE